MMRNEVRAPALAGAGGTKAKTDRTLQPSGTAVNTLAALAEQIVGPIDWQTPERGFCACPGIGLHNTPNGPRDCAIYLAGVPSLHCQHGSCADAIASANHRLRSSIAKAECAGGATLIMPRAKRQIDPEAQRLDRATRLAEQTREIILKDYAWPLADILEDSPVRLWETDAPQAHFRQWLSLWRPEETLWVGQPTDSGRPECACHFKTPREWSTTPPPYPNFTCGSAFKPGCYARTKENVQERRFFIVESDTLSKDEVGAIYRFLREVIGYKLVAIVDSGRRSLHAWFEAQTNPQLEKRLAEVLKILGCDIATMRATQPCRTPGAIRDGNLQPLLWSDYDRD
jgi:hypothetical protein